MVAAAMFLNDLGFSPQLLRRTLCGRTKGATCVKLLFNGSRNLRRAFQFCATGASKRLTPYIMGVNLRFKR